MAGEDVEKREEEEEEWYVYKERVRGGGGGWTRWKQYPLGAITMVRRRDANDGSKM